MNDNTPVDNVRYNLAGADKARALAKRYDRMYDALKRPGKHKITVRIESVFRYLTGGVGNHAVTLDDEDARHLSEWFYQKREAELRRAVAYEHEALRAAGRDVVDVKGLSNWRPQGGINPNRLTIDVSDIEDDPAEEVARENAARG